MRKKKGTRQDHISPHNNLWKEGWMYLGTIVDIVSKPVLILNEDHEVHEANDAFYRTFRIEPDAVKQKNFFDLFNGVFDILELQRRLQVLGDGVHYPGLQITSEFPLLGSKTVILHIYRVYSGSKKDSRPFILLTLEDASEMVTAARVVSNHIREIRLQNSIQIERLKANIRKLEKEAKTLKKSKDF